MNNLYKAYTAMLSKRDGHAKRQCVLISAGRLREHEEYQAVEAEINQAETEQY